MPPSFFGTNNTSAPYGELEGWMILCSSMSLIRVFPFLRLSGLSLYNGLCIGGVSSSKSIINSYIILAGGTPIGNSDGKTSAYSFKTFQSWGGRSGLFKCFTSVGPPIFNALAPSSAFLTMPRNALLSSSSSSTFCCCIYRWIPWYWCTEPHSSLALH